MTDAPQQPQPLPARALISRAAAWARIVAALTVAVYREDRG